MATSTLGSGTLVLAGTTSGTTTVTATAVAGTTTLTLPAATDTLVGKATTDTLTNKTLTGAAMNGTLGATTPSTVAATTLTTSSTVTHNGGTANGVAYLDGSKVLTTGSALVFDGTNLGLGVTPSASSLGKSMQIGALNGITLFGYSNGCEFGNNFYYNSSYLYGATGSATRYTSGSGIHAWYIAPSGTAGNAITFTQAMTLDASGNLGIGTTSPRSVSGYTSLGLNNTTGVLIDNFVGGTRTSGIATTASSMTVGTITSIPLTFLTADTERARIDTSGNLLVGSTTASAVASSKIYVKTSNQYGIISEQAATGQWCYSSNALTNGGTFYHFNFLENGTQRGSITSNGTATTYGTSSDYRLKENIAPMTGALSTVAQLNPVTYKWKSNGSDGQGFIAHELQAIVPDAVVGEKDAVNEDGSIKPQGIDTSFLVATLTAAIQEQQALITTLTARITALESA